MTPRFPKRPWHQVAERVAKATFRIYTDKAMGTGFLITVGRTKSSFHAMLATAWHVIESHESGLAVKICDQLGQEIVSSDGGNITGVQIGRGIDSGIITVSSKTELFPQDWLLPILPYEDMLIRGVEIGWLGYPGITEPELCFFHGHISGFFNEPPVYLVDGVAINGVSGGPVFDDRCHIIGLVSAYLPNRIASDTTLPGVSMMVPINFIYHWLQIHHNPRVLDGQI